MLMAARKLSSAVGLAIFIHQIDTQSFELMGLLFFIMKAAG
jgi:hypothetical protein